MPLQINNPTIGQLLQAAFQLQGRVRPVLEESVIATISLGDLSEGSPPPITRHASLEFTIAGVASEQAVWRLEIPGSVIAVVTNFQISPNSNLAVEAFFGSSLAGVDIPTTVAARFTDGRLLQQGERPAGVVLHGTKVGGLVTSNWKSFAFVSPDRPAMGWTPKGWVCGSGDPVQFGFIEWAAVLNNANVDVTIEWDEYQLF